MVLVGAIAYLGLVPALNTSSPVDRPLLAAARRATLSITVSERGNLESCVTVDGICELNGNQNKIIYLVPEGTKVKKGDIVCKFDGSEIQKNIAQQDIKVKQASRQDRDDSAGDGDPAQQGESDIIAARVEMTLAKLDLEKYEKGDFPAETPSSKGEIGLKEKDLEEAKNKLDQYRPLIKKGLKTKEHVRSGDRLRPRELELMQAPSNSSSRSRRSTRRSGRRPSSARRPTRPEEGAAGQGDRQGPDVQGRQRIRVGQGHRRHRAATVQGIPDPEGQDGHAGRAGRHRRLHQRPLLVRFEPARSAKGRPFIRVRRSSACPT